MNIYVDIDNTICETEGSDYERSVPIPERISDINGLYDAGHRITYWTARGNTSGRDLKSFTESQLDQWGCKRHGLIMGKPSFDLFIDDKVISANSFFKGLRHE